MRSTYYRLDCQGCIEFVVAGPLFIYKLVDNNEIPAQNMGIETRAVAVRNGKKVPTKKLVWGLGDICKF